MHGNKKHKHTPDSLNINMKEFGKGPKFEHPKFVMRN